MIKKIASFPQPLDRQILEIIEGVKNLSVGSLPVYANNTAALAGGLAVGKVYRTSTGVLMVVY